MSSIFDVLSDETRRSLLELLLKRAGGPVEEREVSVSDLVEALALTQPTVSKHLKVLRDADLVRVREDGQRRLYSLNTDPLGEVAEWIAPFVAKTIGTSVGGAARTFGREFVDAAEEFGNSVIEPGEHKADRIGEAIGSMAASVVHGVQIGAEAMNDTVVSPIRRVIRRDK